MHCFGQTCLSESAVQSTIGAFREPSLSHGLPTPLQSEIPSFGVLDLRHDVMATSATTLPRLIIPQLTRSSRTFGSAAFGGAIVPISRGAHSASSERAARSRPTALWPRIQARTWQPTTARGPAEALRSRRSFSTTGALQKDHHFDTLKFVQRLRDEGFSEEQAVAMMRVMSDVIEERYVCSPRHLTEAFTKLCSIQNLTRTMVIREEQEKATYTQKVDFAKLRSELMTADSTESSLTRSSHERLTNELAKLNSRLRDEIQRTQASVRLDLNLEKGRIREEANVQELKLKETETRIEQETAQLRERLEAVKFSTLQWLMYVYTVPSCGTRELTFAGAFARVRRHSCWVFGVCSCEALRVAPGSPRGLGQV